MPNEKTKVEETDNFLVATTDAPVADEPKDETPEPEAVAIADDDDAESKDEPSAEEGSKETKQKPKKNRTQRRIETLSAERNQANDKVAELEAKLADKDAKKSDGEIDPADFETFAEYEKAVDAKIDPADFETFAEYEQAVDAKDSPKKETKQPQPNKEYVQAMEELQVKFDGAADKYDDFDDKIQNPDLKITQHMVMAFNELENSTELAYYYASNTKEAEKVSKMSSAKQIISVVNKSMLLKKKPMQKTTNAPEPIEPVGSGEEYQKPINEMNFKEFEKTQNSKVGGKKFW